MSTSATFPLPAYEPASAEVGGLVYVEDHRTEAEVRLLAQFDDAPKLHALVRALVGPLQELEQAALGVLEVFDVQTVSGAQLDVVGRLVGESRQGRADALYRAYVKARILTNSADGRPDGIYAVVRALLGDGVLSARIDTVPPAHYDLTVAAAALAFPWDTAADVPTERVAVALADAVFLATSAGIGLTLYYQYTDDAHTFLFASGDAEEDDALRGLALDTDEGTYGGALIGAEERS